MITYSKILQIASVADQLASKKNLETPQLVDKNSSSHGCGPQKVTKTIVFAAHAIVNRQHDDVQSERSLGTNLSQLNENENG